MNHRFKPTCPFRWTLAVMVLKYLALPLLDSGILKARFISLAAVEDETDWTLALATEVGVVDVVWTLGEWMRGRSVGSGTTLQSLP